MLTYKATDSGSRFIAGRKFIKGIMGPIGCLPADTEFLTPKGWVRMDAWQPGDLVGVWSEGRVRFEECEYVNLPAEEDFYVFDSGSLVMELSPEHNVPHYKWDGEFAVAPAAYVAAKPSRREIPTTFELERPDAPISDDEIRLRVAFCADGHTRRAGKRDRFTLRKERKKQRLAQLLRNLGIPFTAKVHGARPTEMIFSIDAERAGFDLCKNMDFLWSLSSRQLAVAVQESTLWDGLANHAEKRFATKDKAQADAIQFAAHASGLRATLTSRQDTRHPHHAPMHTVAIRCEGSAKNKVYVREGTRISRIPPPDGRKYCFDTSTGYFVARCRGSVFVTGNSGKSTVALFDLLARAVEQEPFNGVRRTRFGLLRNTVAQLRSTVKPLVDTWMVTMVSGRMGRWTQTQGTLTFEARFELGDGTTVESDFMLLAADTPEDVRRLLSLELSAAWVEEAREVDPEVFSGLQGRVNRFPSRAAGGVTYPGVTFSTNPPPLGGFWHELISSPPANAEIFIQPPAILKDGTINPKAENLENLAPDYYDNLLEGKTAEWIDVYLRNQFGQGNAGKPVFKASFNRQFHVAEAQLKAVPQSVNPLVIGMDNGLQAAATMMQQDLRGRVNVLSECFVPEDLTMGVESFLDRLLIPHLRGKYPQFNASNILFVLDPACYQRSQVNEMTIAQAVQKRGYRCIQAPTNDPERRIQAVEGLLARQIDGAAGLLIDPSCTHLINALEFGYRYKSTSGSLAFEKNHPSHQAESLQYGSLHFNSPQLKAPWTAKRRQVQPSGYAYAYANG